MPDFCAAVNCSNRSSDAENKVSFFRFPKDTQRCKRWVVNCRRKDLDGKSSDELNKNFRLCSNHFEETMYYPTNIGGKRLILDAVPTIFDVPNPPTRVAMKRKAPAKRLLTPLKKLKTHTDTLATGTSLNNSLSDVRCDKKMKQTHNALLAARVKICRLRKQVQKLKLKSKECIAQPCDGSIEHILHLAQKYLSPDQLRFFQSQLKMNRRTKRGKRWTTADKLLALRIMFHSPQAFNSLRTVFALPSRTTLLLFLSRAFGDLQTGFSAQLFALLKLRVNAMHPKDRNCCLVFDEMSLKQHLDYDRHRDVVYGIKAGKPLNQVLVFVVRGIATKWKQPIAYFFANSCVPSADVASAIQEALIKIRSTGLTVRAVVCDQGPTNITALKLLGFSRDNPYTPHIQHPSHENKIHVIFDPPHLIKNVRNNLIRHDIIVDGKRVSWKHLEAVYNLDKMNSVRMMPKLTDRHLDPGPLLAMKVKLATQLFSHQVAASLSMCATHKLLPAEVGHTAEFVERIDKLFDMMNSRKLYADKPARCALTMSSDNMQHLAEQRAWIQTWRFADVKNQSNIASHWGLSITIDSILSLSKELLSEGFHFVCTSRFNQDCIENFFSIIRSKGGWNDRPTTRQFRAAYQNALVLLSVEKTKSNANCLHEEDFDVALDLNVCIDMAKNSEPAENSIFRGTDRHIKLPKPQMSIECRDEEVFSESVENVLCYVAGWLIRKSRLCNECEATLCIPENSLITHHGGFIEAKRYSADCKLLQPTSLVQLLVHEMEAIFLQKISTCLEGTTGISQKIMKTINDQCNFSFIFALHPEHALHIQDSLVRNFVITRIYYYIKFYNRELSPRNKKNHKKMARVVHK